MCTRNCIFSICCIAYCNILRTSNNASNITGSVIGVIYSLALTG